MIFKGLSVIFYSAIYLYIYMHIHRKLTNCFLCIIYILLESNKKCNENENCEMITI